MEKFTLEPEVWTRFYGRLFQVIGQEAIRITIGETETDTNGNGVPVAPASDALYFTTQGYDPKIIDLDDWGLSSPAYIYLMPEDNQAVTIVAF